MPRRVTRNQAGGQTCDACDQMASCVSWTIYQSGGIGWQNSGTVHLCRACLLAAAAELEGVRFKEVMIAALKTANVTVPHNVLAADLEALLEEHGVPYPGEAGVTAPPSQPTSSGAASSGTAPEEGSIEWWRDKCVAAGVPITNQMNMQTLEARLGVWVQAAELNISLEDNATLSDAREIVAASKAASAGTPA